MGHQSLIHPQVLRTIPKRDLNKSKMRFTCMIAILLVAIAFANANGFSQPDVEERGLDTLDEDFALDGEAFDVHTADEDDSMMEEERRCSCNKRKPRRRNNRRKAPKRPSRRNRGRNNRHWRG